MCGIAGILHFDGRRAIDERLLRKMNGTLRHRGPDDEGYVIDGPVGLAMRRLSIIDLDTGQQPVHNEDKTVSTVFNGEIYNYRDLTAQLRAKGHTFYTASDTEVLVHLYEEYGAECVDHLRGMFAFAVWDRNSHTLLIARDRLGVKPLYYSIDGERLLFGSELKALLADPELPRAIDLEGLATYLRYGYVVDPRTILKSVRKLPPGHLLVARAGRTSVKCYWDVVPFFADPRPVKSEAECQAELADLLTESVRLRLVSDVPIGAFLSGGIDSSMVVALMARTLDRPVKTFSIGFEEDAFNELPYARTAARHLGTDHHELVLRPERIDILGSIVWHLDEPFGDPCALPMYFLARLARESVKVALSGDGGDEVFGGYDRYLEHLRRGVVDIIPPVVRRSTLGAVSRLLPEAAPGKRLLFNLSLPPIERYLDSVSYFPSELQRRVLSPDVLAKLERESDSNDGDSIRRLAGVDRLSRMQALDFLAYLPGDILVKVDRLSMAHSIEAREPLLDHKLVEYMAGLGPSLKVRGGAGKYLFKQLAREYLPGDLVTRKKQGFAVPLRAWFREEVSGFLRSVLTDLETRQRGYLEAAEVRRLVDEHTTGRRDHTNRLWILMMLEMWHRTVLPG